MLWSVPQLGVAAAAEKDFTEQTEADWVDDRWRKAEVGQFLHATIETPGRRTPKALAIKVGESDEGTVCFDTDTLRYAAGWTGGFVELSPVRYGLMASVKPAGTIQFTTRPGPGVAKTGSWDDPRQRGLGPLPRDWARYRGLYLSGKRVAIAYTAGPLEVLETPWIEKVQDQWVFTREIEVRGEGELLLRVSGANTPVFIEPKDETCQVLELPNGERGVRIHSTGLKRAVISIGGKSGQAARPLERFTRGGAPTWLPEIVTQGVVGREDGPFEIDTLTMPYDNRWNALMFASGHDFLPNGEALLATAHGDVWLVSGIDQDLRGLRWKRFATGLYQPLGLKVRDGKIFVLERDQITVLHDLNGDREADFYENFSNDCISGGGVHSYTTSLETDSGGNFYFTKCGEDTPHGGAVLKVDARGEGIEVIATGFRNPNGLGIGPGNVLTVADQQGDWVPETRLDVIKPGGFYGYMPMHKRAVPPTGFDAPLCWVPRAVDNSAGGQVWVPEGLWGALGGQMFHLSYGRCTMMAILRDGANGGIAPLPGRFLSGVMRGRFHPGDGALYLSGLRGWQTAAVRDGCFQRVRRTKQPLTAPIGFKLHPDAIELRFEVDLEKDLASDLSGYAAEEWNYRWSRNYGSPDYSRREKNKVGRDKRELAAARLVDSRTLLLRFKEPLAPVNTLRVSYNLESSEGQEIQGDFYCTINE